MPVWLIILIAFLLVDFLLVVWVYFRKYRSRKLSDKEMTYIRSHWIRIIDSFVSHTNQAILDADKILDYALSKQGFNGTVGEKLKKAGPRFSDLDGIWKAHRLRNRIAHELDEVDRDEAKWALKNFKQALNDLGARL